MLLASPPRFWLVIPVPQTQGLDHNRKALAVPSTLSFATTTPEVVVPIRLARQLAPLGVHRIVFFGDLTHHLRRQRLDWPLMGVHDWHGSISELVRLAQACPQVSLSRYEHGLVADPSAEFLRGGGFPPHNTVSALRKYFRRTLLQYWAAEGQHRLFSHQRPVAHIGTAVSRRRGCPRGV